MLFKLFSFRSLSACHALVLRSSLPCWALHCAYVRRWQSCQPGPNLLTVIYAEHICLHMWVCILAAAECVCVCVWVWLHTFCSINKPRHGSQLASAYFSVRHVSNLLRKIFFNLAIGNLAPLPASLHTSRSLALSTSTPLTFGKWHLLTAYFSFAFEDADAVWRRFNWHNNFEAVR